MRNFIKTFLIAACLAAPSSMRAADLGTVIGIAKTITQTVSGIIGKTTVTPAYAVHYWTRRAWGQYGSFHADSAWTVRRCPFTHNYAYEHTWLESNGTQGRSTDVFVIPYLRRVNYRCELGPQFVYNELVTFNMAVWAYRVDKSGWFAPGEPYDAFIKARMTRVQDTCEAAPYEIRTIRPRVQIYDSGIRYIRFQHMPYEYDYPMLCWVGAFTDY